jgi:hypothetical protein
MTFLPNPKHKRKIVPSPTVLVSAKTLYQKYTLARVAYPEDHWIAINKYWDLNLFTDDEGQHKATLYPVIDGNTDSTQPFPVILNDEIHKLAEQRMDELIDPLIESTKKLISILKEKKD